MELTEKELDQLHQLTQARATRILEQGRPFALSGTEKSTQGLITDDCKSIQFPTGTSLNVGQIYSSKGIDYFVSDCVAKAGCVEATVEEISGYAQVFEKHLVSNPNPTTPGITHLKQTAVKLPVLSWDGSQLTVPRFSAGCVGRVVKHRGCELEVVNAAIKGAMAVLTIKPYHAPQPGAPTGKTYQPTTSRMPAPSASKFYGSYYN